MIKYNVLDHGFVRRVDYMGDDLSIVRNARVSYDAAWRAGEDTGSDARLIRYLYKNKHNTPFEAVTFTFEVKAPIFVFRQWHRHRTQSYNELSARYRQLPSDYYLPRSEDITTQSTDNKQGRTETVHPDADEIQKIIKKSNEFALESYRELINMDCPKELARTVMPVSTYSHMFCTVNLHNLFNFLRERLHPHAQYEIQMYAKALLVLAKPICPVAFSVFEEELV